MGGSGNPRRIAGGSLYPTKSAAEPRRAFPAYFRQASAGNTIERAINWLMRNGYVKEPPMGWEGLFMAVHYSTGEGAG